MRASSERPRASDAGSDTKDARSPHTPADGEPGPEPTGRELFIGNRLFNEAALKNSAELEPIDNPIQSTTPHQRQILAALGMVLVGAAAWLVLGAVDHSLWLNAERLEDDAGSASVPTQAMRLRAVVSPTDAERLTPGMTAFVFQDGSTGAFIEGSISRVAGETTRADRTILALDISPQSMPIPEPGDANRKYRLRIPIGSQTPMALLVGLARQRIAQTGDE